MLKKILTSLGLYRPFTHNPKDFQLRIVESWFSNEYIQFEYTANGGRDWKIIHHCEPPYLGFLHYDYEWKRLTYRLGNGNFESEKQKFSSYQKILDYEKVEEEALNDGNKRLVKQREEAENQRQSALNRANK